MYSTRILIVSLLAAGIADSHPGHESAPPGRELTIAVQTGKGTNRFETSPGWGRLPEKKPIGPTHGGVAVDRGGRIYVSTDAAHAILVYKPDGAFEKAIAPDCVGVHGLQMVADGGKEFLFGAHLKGQRIVKLDLAGKIVMQIPNEGTGEIPQGFKGLTGVAVAPDGSIFAACGYGSNLIHKFDPAGKLLKSAGGKGSGEGTFKTCHGLTMDLRGEEPLLLVADRENQRLTHLSLDLEWKGVHSENLRRPCAMSIHGQQCAVAELAGRVTVLGADGAHLAYLGDNPDPKQRANFKVPAEEMEEGIFTAPHGLSYDASGNLYVQDWNATGRVTKLVKLTQQ